MRRFLLLSAALISPIQAQHDPGRGAVRHLAKGEIEQTLNIVEKAPKRSNSPIDEAEKDFVKLMVACHQNKPAEAFELAKKSVANGLPIVRLEAGPREKLKVLHAHEPYQKWVADKSTVLVHGPMLQNLRRGSERYRSTSGSPPIQNFALA